MFGFVLYTICILPFVTKKVNRIYCHKKKSKKLLALGPKCVLVDAGFKRGHRGNAPSKKQNPKSAVTLGFPGILHKQHFCRNTIFEVRIYGEKSE